MYLRNGHSLVYFWFYIFAVSGIVPLNLVHGQENVESGGALLESRNGRGLLDDHEPTNAPLCGPLSVYAFLKLEGLEFDFKQFLKEQYTTEELLDFGRSASLRQLSELVEDHGYHVLPVKEIGREFLLGIEKPVLLHVRSNDAPSDTYNHFVLLLGVTDTGDAVFLDLPSPPQKVPVMRLQEIMSGYGLVLSKAPFKNHFQATSLASIWFISAFVLCILMALIPPGRNFVRSLIRGKGYS